MSSRQVIQRLARQYREQTGSSNIDPLKFAAYLISQGVKPPRVPTELELMARTAKNALKHEIRVDSATNKPYRGWHAVPTGEDRETGQRIFSYYDIDDAERLPMQKALALRVSGMIDDGVQLSLDAEHWNRINPAEEPISVDEMMSDIPDQVQWRKNARFEDDDLDDESDPVEPDGP